MGGERSWTCGCGAKHSDNGKVPVAEFELYDLLTDPSETRNIADRNPEVAARMKRELTTFVKSCEASANGEDYR